MYQFRNLELLFGREASRLKSIAMDDMATANETTASADTKRVLIYRLGSLGDTLVALPALHLVERAFPKAERRVLTNVPVNVKAPPAAAVLEGSGLGHGD